MALPGDVTDQASMEQACAKLVSEYGTIDILVNGAGGNQPGATIGPDDSFCQSFSTEAFDKVGEIEILRVMLLLNLRCW